MAEFSAAHALREVDERAEQLHAGDRIVPIITAVIAVFAALATLFSNHSSVSGLQSRTQAVLFLTKASDSYNYYESKRIKVEINQALLQSGVTVTSPAASKMQQRINDEQRKASGILKQAQAAEARSDADLENAEHSMRSYESYEVSATLFEVSIVLVSITALMRKSRGTAYIGLGATLIGLGFFISGLLK